MSKWTQALAARLMRSVALNPKPRPATRPGKVPRFRPAVHELEDRTVPSGSDLFGGATVLAWPFATDTGSNAGATGEAGEPDLAGADPALIQNYAGPIAQTPVNSVWWRWTALESGRVEVNTVGSDFDTILAVYTGSAVDNLTLIGANDDTFNVQSRVLFDAVAGTTYHFAVDGFEDQVGDIRLSVGTAPANDAFASASALTGETATATGWNLAATNQSGEVNPLNDAPINSVWWRWTALGSGPVEFNTFGSNFDTNLSVFTGSGLGSLTAVDSNDDYNGVQSRVAFEAVGGTTYYIAVDGFLQSTGSITLNMPVSPAPTNHPPVILDQSFAVDENSPAGTVVGTVAASDPDADQTLTYSITGGNEAGAFAIDGATGEITVADPAALDFEASPSLSLTVRVTDDGLPVLSASAEVVVNLNDLNESPSFNPAGPFATDENGATGTVVGSVSATDPDAGQSLGYAIVGGNTDGAFAIDPATGQITVANPAALDYETTPSFALTVRATDSGSPALSADAVLVIDLNDVNEAPQVAGGPFVVDSNAPAGALVGSVSATDPDSGQSLTYSIEAGNDAGAFAIDPATGQITVANTAALSGVASFDLTVRVTDTASPALSAEAVVTVTVNPANSAPVLDNSGNMSLATISPGATNNPGTLVAAILASAGRVRVADADSGAVSGIAVVAANTDHGTWQYSTDGGSTWSPLGPVSDGSARLLAVDALTRVRFVPAAGYSGTVAEGITFRAWDQTTGANGGTASTTVSGGSSAFSSATETASVAVRSAAQQIVLIAADVTGLVLSGKLSVGRGVALQASLVNALVKLNQGNTAAAVNNLHAFIDKVEEVVGCGRLPHPDGRRLIDAAKAAITSVLC